MSSRYVPVKCKRPSCVMVSLKQILPDRGPRELKTMERMTLRRDVQVVALDELDEMTYLGR